MPHPAGRALYIQTCGLGPKIAMVHGFTQTGESWGRFAELLCLNHELLKVDAPGHGKSSGVCLDIPETAELLADQVGDATYLGYSLGARICLRSAIDHPGQVSRLIVISGSPGIADGKERSVRLDSDNRLADSIVDVREFLEQWLSQPLFCGLPPDARQVESRLENTPDGLAWSLRLSGTGSQQPLWDRLSDLEIPVLIVAGETDTKFSAIGRRMASAIGENAQLSIIAGAGHAAHLEKPDEVAAIVERFLNTCS